MTRDFDKLIGRCRCKNHAENYKPRSHNQSRTYYFLSEELTPTQFICGACMQNNDTPVHGGLVISEESKERGIVVFEAFAGYVLSTEQINNLKKIWPK
jgi:hypothetical protein